MTGMETTIVHDAEADVRWRDWRSRGARADRKRASTIRALTVLVSIGLAIWAVFRLL